MTNGWSSMGFGIPLPWQLKKNPKATVVCVTGDGGFLRCRRDGNNEKI